MIDPEIRKILVGVLERESRTAPWSNGVGGV